MVRRASARRHAQAVFEIALERKELEKWRSDLETIGEVLKEGQVFSLLQNPKLSFKKKMHLLEDLLPGIDSLTGNFLALLVAKNRLEIFAAIAVEYNRLLNAYYGVEHAEVTTAVPLDKAEQQQLQGRLSALVGKRLVLTNKVDPNLIGGMLARVGDKLIDGSLRTRLQRLKESLVTGG